VYTATNIDPQRVTAPTRSSHWWTLIVSTITIIATAHLFPLLHLNKPGLIENRILAEAPKLPTSIAQWAAMPRQLDAFVDDNFPPRANMIAGLNYLRYRLGYSGSNKIIVGRDGWLFYDDGSHLGVVSGRVRLDPESMRYWILGLKQRIDYLNRRGIKFYMTIGPVKEDIYPEHRPHWMPKKRVDNEIDDLFRLAHQAGYTQLIDPRPAFLTEKGRQILYDGNDTHWTGLGAYLGYQALMSRVAQDFPDLTPLPLAALNLQPNTDNLPRDLSLMLGIANYVSHDRVSFITLPIHDPARTDFLSPRHDWTAPQVLHTDSPTGKTVVLLRDSFTSEMLPMLKAHFSTIVMAHLQDGLFRTDLIERYHPDAVILVVIEAGMRHVMSMMPELETR
jgi:hypothetical protein